MNTKDFAYSLNKILSEEIAGLEFNVEKDPYGVYGINVSLPRNIRPVFHKEKCYIGMDDLKDKVELYARYGEEGYENFGRFSDPQQALPLIEKYLVAIYGDVIKQADNPDFFFSSELQDFLRYNNISVRTYKPNQPHLILSHPSYPFTYFIDFSEYNGKVFVELEKASPSEKSWDLPDYFDEDFNVLYKSDLSKKNQQKVFSDLLAIFKKEGLDKN